MKPLNFAQTAPLNQDSEGTIRLTGSRVTLDTLVAAFKKGNTPEQIQDSFPSLSLAQIKGAITWYLNHQGEVEEYLKEREVEAQLKDKIPHNQMLRFLIDENLDQRILRGLRQQPEQRMDRLYAAQWDGVSTTAR